MKKQLLKAFAHPVALPTITALYGVAAGYFWGVKVEKGRYVGRDDVTIEEAKSNPDQFRIEFPDMEHQDSLSFDRPPTGPREEAPVEEDEVTPEARAEILRHLGRITEVKEVEEGTVMTMELDEEGARLKAEADAELEARTAMSIYADPETEPDVIDNIFVNPVGEWNYDEEIAKRGLRDPYVLHADEYHAEEGGFRQAQLTYYAGDDVMTDEDDQPVFNFEDITGPLMWGHGSNTQDLFYVRNPRLEAEYEITRSYEAYAHAILGIEAEAAASAEDIRHSRRLPRLSQDD